MRDRESQETRESTDQELPQNKKAREEARRRTQPADNQAMQRLVEEKLGDGRPLDGSTRQRMERAFGRPLGDVRVHTGGSSERLADQEGARAITVGADIAFAAGEYRPGTPVGDALLAHEVAHVLQQRAAGPKMAAFSPDSGDSALEADADQAAVSAIASLWSGNLARTALPRLRSGLRLQRCDKGDAKVGERPTKVIAHGASPAAVKVAEERMTQVFSSLRSPDAAELKGTTVELHIIPHDKKLTDLSEFAHLKGTRTFDGRLYDDLRGVGGTKVGDTIRYAVAEEQLISIPGKPSGYAQGFVAAHESAHIIEQFGMTENQKKKLQKAYDARKAAGGPWLAPASYTSANTGEYFAQGASAYFRSPYSDSKADKESYTPEWLAKNDPDLYSLLKEIFK